MSIPFFSLPRQTINKLHATLQKMTLTFDLTAAAAALDNKWYQQSMLVRWQSVSLASSKEVKGCREVILLTVSREFHQSVRFSRAHIKQQQELPRLRKKEKTGSNKNPQIKAELQFPFATPFSKTNQIFFWVRKDTGRTHHHQSVFPGSNATSVRVSPNRRKWRSKSTK